MKPFQQVQLLPIARITPDPEQPRVYFDPKRLEELAQSIGQIGLKQPIYVRPGKEPKSYIIVAGERRWRSCKSLGWTEMPCFLTEFSVDSLVFSLVENLQREELNPIEEARGLQRLITERGLNQNRVAELIGKTDFHVSTRLSLLRLPAEHQQLVAEGALSVSVGIMLTRRCETHEEMQQVVESAVKFRQKRRQGITAVSVAQITGILDERDRRKTLQKSQLSVIANREDTDLAKNLNPALSQLLELFESLVNSSGIPADSQERCVRTWLLLSERDQQRFLQGLRQINDKTVTLLNHLKGGRNRTARRV